MTIELWANHIHLWSMVVCFVCHFEISQTMVLHAMLLVSSRKLSMSKACTDLVWDCLDLECGSLVLIIESFSQWKLNKIEPEKCKGIWGCSWCWWKALDKSNLIDFISQFSKQNLEHPFSLKRHVIWLKCALCGEVIKLHYCIHQIIHPNYGWGSFKPFEWM
jgi:hypothetical protein